MQKIKIKHLKNVRETHFKNKTPITKPPILERTYKYKFQEGPQHSCSLPQFLKFAPNDYN